MAQAQEAPAGQAATSAALKRLLPHIYAANRAARPEDDDEPDTIRVACEDEAFPEGMLQAYATFEPMWVGQMITLKALADAGEALPIFRETMGCICIKHEIKLDGDDMPVMAWVPLYPVKERILFLSMFPTIKAPINVPLLGAAPPSPSESEKDQELIDRTLKRLAELIRLELVTLTHAVHTQVDRILREPRGSRAPLVDEGTQCLSDAMARIDNALRLMEEAE